MTNSRRSWWVAWALAVAMGLRLIAAIGWQQHLGGTRELGFPDSHGYWHLARQIVHGQPYQYGGPELSVFRAPVYPLVLAGLFFMIGDDPPVLWGRLVGAVGGTLAVAGLALLAGRLFDQRAARIAAWMAACYPGAIGMSVFILSEAVFVPLMVLQLSCWAAAWQATTRRATVRWALLAGIATGLATLARPSWMLFMPMAVAAAILFSRARLRHLAIGTLMVTAMCLVMCPWWVRNYRVTGTWVPTTLQLGASLYDGLNPRANGASNMWFARPFYKSLADADARQQRPSRENFEVRLDRRLRDAAIAWAESHPNAVIRLAVRKFARIWSPWPHATELQSWPIRLVIAVGYVPLLVCGVLGTVVYARRGWPYLLCALPAVYFTMLHVIFVGSIRYRQPAMVMAIVLAAGYVGKIRNKK